MGYIYHRDIEDLVRQLKPLGEDLKKCVLEAQPGEDPIDLFLEELRQRQVNLPDLNRRIEAVLPTLDWQWFITQIGLTQEVSFFAEISRRLEERFLPPLQRQSEVLWFVNAIFDDDISWLSQLKAPHFERLLRIFASDAFQWPDYFLQHLQISIEVLAQRISGSGLDTLIARRLQDREDLHRQFLDLGRLSFSERDAFKRADNVPFLKGLKGCENAISYIRERCATEGVSLVLTYRLVQIEELISRLKLAIHLMQSESPEESLRKLGLMFQKIVMAHYENIRVRYFLGRNLEILAYQVTVLAERTGEHYISNNARELRAMWWKAIKGAMVVAVLVLLKTLLSKIHFPPLLQAFTYGSLYAAGFVVIHLIGGVLATKQPAMTASTLAAAMDGAENSEESLKNLLEAIVRTLRTQIAALLGNYLFAFPIAVLLVFPFLVGEQPIIGFEKAHHMIEDLHPFYSLSFFYAAVAGVCLFLSGLISGLADNWFDFNKIGDRLELILSGPRGKRFVARLRENFGIWMGNIILGFMLGSMSTVGQITGLPLDIRHVTFASGAFGIGWIHQPFMMAWGEFFLIAGSVLCMGLINLVVSFSLSLFVATQSRRLKFRQGRKLLSMVLMRLLKSPLELFIHRDRGNNLSRH